MVCSECWKEREFLPGLPDCQGYQTHYPYTFEASRAVSLFQKNDGPFIVLYRTSVCGPNYIGVCMFDCDRDPWIPVLCSGEGREKWRLFSNR